MRAREEVWCLLKRNQRLINAKIMQYLLPGILMAMALQLGNVVDAVFVGNFLGTDAMASLNLALPVDTLIQIPGYVLGMGGSMAAGIMLGKRDIDGASRLFSSTFFITLASGAVFALVGAVASHRIGALLASGGALSEMTGDYLLGQMLGAPIIGIGLLMVSYLGVENHPGLAGAYIIVSNVVNLAVDYCLLRFTDMGILAASVSTVVGFFLGFAVLIFYVRSPKRMIKLRWICSLHSILQALKTGLPVLMFMIMTLVKALALNIIVLKTLGEMGIEVMTICEQVLMLVEMLTGGIIGIIPNLAGVLYGEKDYFGIRVLCNKVLLYSAIAAAVVFITVMALPSQMAGMFGVRDAELMAITSRALRVFMLCIPFFVWNKFLISYYESIEQSKQATVITLMQSGVFAIPTAAIGIYMSISLGADGYVALAVSGVIAEVLTVVTALIYRRLKYKGEGFYMLPERSDEVCLDFTMQADISRSCDIPKGIIAFCEENGVDRSKANFAAVAAEEMFANCVKYGGRGARWIDICLTIYEKKMLLRIRDNGKPFDPLEYVYDKDEFESIHGINIIKSISTSMNYIRSIDMNNTVIEFDLERLPQKGE